MIDPASGILLIADPFLKDPNFLRSVVFLCEHHPEGSFGFALNRPADSTLDQLIPDFAGHPFPVFIGGPVQMNSLHFLHQCPDIVPGAEEVIPGVFWGGTYEDVKAGVLTGRILPHQIRFFAGYSGWGEGQLAGEMEEKTWLTVEATPGLVFHPDHGEIWKDALRTLGGDYTMMINFPLDPQLN